MTVKDEIVDMMRRQGYDFFTASEWATKILAEFLDGKKAEMVLCCGKERIKIRRRQ